ncbi:hypothetical protein HK405_002077, partial [Cladochytrium tenue]
SSRSHGHRRHARNRPDPHRLRPGCRPLLPVGCALRSDGGAAHVQFVRVLPGDPAVVGNLVRHPADRWPVVPDRHRCSRRRVPGGIARPLVGARKAGRGRLEPDLGNTKVSLEPPQIRICVWSWIRPDERARQLRHAAGRVGRVRNAAVCVVPFAGLLFHI